jgi:hypothetical protein
MILPWRGANRTVGLPIVRVLAKYGRFRHDGLKCKSSIGLDNFPEEGRFFELEIALGKADKRGSARYTSDSVGRCSLTIFGARVV